MTDPDHRRSLRFQSRSPDGAGESDEVPAPEGEAAEADPIHERREELRRMYPDADHHIVHDATEEDAEWLRRARGDDGAGETDRRGHECGGA